jgi:hypothetical protein
MPLFRRRLRAFSSKVDTGLRRENAIKQRARAPFRVNRNGKGSRFLFACLPLIVAPYAACAQDHLAGPKIELGIGWSALNINDIEFTAITDAFFTEVLDHQTNEDGELDGYKLTGEFSGFMPHRRGNWLASYGVRGFYSHYEDDEQTRCVFTATTDCFFIPLVDPDPTGTVNLGPEASGGFGDWLTDVSRSVTYWGAAVEMNLARDSVMAGLKDGGGSLKDAPAPVVVEASPFVWKVGLGARRLDQSTSLFSEDRGPTLDPVTLNDELDTTYYGGYFGFVTTKPLGGQFRLKLNAETGLYYADADYEGTYTATASLGNNQPVDQTIELSDSGAAFIGLLNLAIERDIGPATLSLFGEAEWISYAPKVLYNDTDRAGGFPFDITGSQDGTEIGGGSALTYTVGARLTVPLR